jgi:hypothetical protein
MALVLLNPKSLKEAIVLNYCVHNNIKERILQAGKSPSTLEKTKGKKENILAGDLKSRLTQKFPKEEKLLPQKELQEPDYRKDWQCIASNQV